MHQASSIKHQASSIKHQASSIKHQASSIIFTFCGMFSAIVSAVTSEPSTPVSGRPPIVSNVTISSLAPRVGDQVEATWTYSDADGDDELDSLVEWLLVGQPLPLATGNPFTLPDILSGKMLQARITPRSAPPAYPSQGVAVSSNAVAVLGRPILNDADFAVSSGAVAGAINPVYSQNAFQVKVMDETGFPVSDIDVYLEVTSGEAAFSTSGDKAAVLKTNSQGVVSGYLVSSIDGSNVLSARLANGQQLSKPSTFVAPIINRFVTPTAADVYHGNGRAGKWHYWDHALLVCSSRGLRNPTVGELTQLYNESTSGKFDNYDMCSIHGWPLSGGRCGGVVNSYISDHYASADSVAAVGLGGVGHGGNVNTAHLACIKP